MSKFSITVLRNSAFGMAGQIAIKVLSFGFSILIIRHLGAEDFGQYAAVTAFGMIFASLADLGLGIYTVREVARLRDAPDGQTQAAALYGNVMALRLLLAMLAALLIIIVAWFTGRPWIMIGAIALNGLSLVMYGVQGASDAVLAGFERLDLSAGAKVLNQLIFVFFGGVFLYWGLGYYGLIYAGLLGVALMTYVCWRAVSRLGLRLTWPSPSVWLTLLRVSFPFGVIGLALGWSYKFDSVLLNIYWGDEVTGYYAAAYNLIFSAVMISNVVNTALYPSLARQSATAEHRLPAIYERALRYLLIIALPIAVGGWVLAEQLVPFLFTANFAPGVPALRILIWVVPLMYVSEFLGYVVVVAGKESQVARAVLISTGVNVAVNLVMVPYFGFLGAAVMTLVTEAVLVGQYLWLLRPLLRYFKWGQVLFGPLLAAVVMGLGVFLVQPYFSFLVNVLIGAASYPLFLLALGVAGREELHFVRGLVDSRLGAVR